MSIEPNPAKIAKLRERLSDAERVYLLELGKINADGRYSDEYRGQLRTASLDKLASALDAVVAAGAIEIKRASQAARSKHAAAQREIERDTRFDAIPVMARQYAAELHTIAQSSAFDPDAPAREFQSMLASARETGDRTALHALIQVATENGSVVGGQDPHGGRLLLSEASRALTEATPPEVLEARVAVEQIEADRRELAHAAYRVEEVTSAGSYRGGYAGGAAWLAAATASPTRRQLEPHTVPSPTAVRERS